MISAILEGLDLNGQSNGYIIEAGIQGLEAADISLTTYDRAGEDGIRIPAGFSRGRLITITGVVKGECIEDHLARRRALSALIPPVRVNSLLQHKTFRFIDSDGSDYTVQVEVQQPFNMPRSNLLNSRYQLHLLATDPALYGTTEHSVVLTPATFGFFTIPFTIPFSLGGGVSGTTTVVNAGGVNSYPVITLAGPLTNPTVSNLTTGQTMQLTMTIGAGSSVVIDMMNKTIVLDGTTNEISEMDPSSEFWALAPGNNLLKLATSVSGEAGSATITWHDAYAGI